MDEDERQAFRTKVVDLRKWLGVRAPADAAGRWYWSARKRRVARVFERELKSRGFGDPYALIEECHAIYRGE